MPTTHHVPSNRTQGSTVDVETVMRLAELPRTTATKVTVPRLPPSDQSPMSLRSRKWSCITVKMKAVLMPNNSIPSAASKAPSICQ